MRVPVGSHHALENEIGAQHIRSVAAASVRLTASVSRALRKGTLSIGHFAILVPQPALVTVEGTAEEN